MSSHETFPDDVLLSHSAKDKTVVRPLAERIREAGLRLWFDGWEYPSPAGAGDRRSDEAWSANAFGSDPAAAGLEAGVCGRGNLPVLHSLNWERRFMFEFRHSAFVLLPSLGAPALVEG